MTPDAAVVALRVVTSETPSTLVAEEAPVAGRPEGADERRQPEQADVEPGPRAPRRVGSRSHHQRAASSAMAGYAGSP